MIGITQGAWRLAVSLASFGIADVIPGDAGAQQQAPIGAYRSPGASLRLTAEGTETLSRANVPVSIGSYHVAGDTIALRDERGPGGAACGDEPGVYLWRISADTLRLRVLSDRCDGRRSALSAVWMRMLAAGPSLSAVVITAEREAKDLQRSPVAVTALSAEEIREANTRRPEDLTALVPGLIVGSLNGGSAMSYMRGVGNFTASDADPTVPFNFDGVYLARPTAAGNMFYDLDRVEVLKGPQGTLYGRNATGGAINLLPRRPQLGDQSGELSAEYGSHNTQQLTGWYNAPIGERAAIRVAGQRLSHASYMKDGTDDQDLSAGRLAFRFDASNALTLRVGGDYSEQRGHGAGSTPMALGLAARDGITSPAGDAYLESQRNGIAGRNFVALPGDQRANNRDRGVNATLEWKTALGALTVIPAARASDLDGVGTATATLFQFTQHTTQTTAEAHLESTPAARVHLITGGFFFRENLDDFTHPYNEFNFAYFRSKSGTTSIAPFGRVTFDVTNKLRATLGARYTHEDKTSNGSFEGFSRVCTTASCPNAQPFEANPATDPLTFAPGTTAAPPVFNPADGTSTVGFRIFANDSATFSRTTWRGALEYDLTDRAFFYSSYETGFKAGGFFFSNDSGIYKPENVGAFTLGLKSRLLNYRLLANVELFNWRYTDQQVSSIALDSKGVTNFRTQNIGRATIRGVETDMQYLVFANTQLSANVQYLDAVENSYVFVAARDPGSGCPETKTADARFHVDCSGRRAAYSPKWTAGLGANHAFDLSSGQRLVTTVRARYQSKALMGIDFLPAEEQSAYWMLDASLALNTAGDRYSIGLFGQNLTDRTVVSNTWVMPFSTFTVGTLRPPRTVGLRVRAGI